MPETIADRIAALRAGRVPTLLDVFAGCGGLTLGMRDSGFIPVAAAEKDPHAAAVHAANFHADEGAFSHHACPTDVTLTGPAEFAIRNPSLGRHVDLMVGGPPCQAYARVGRAKLRDVAKNPEAYRVDPRGNLYLRYLEWISHFQPLALVMENVPDALNVGGTNVMAETAEALEALGYRARYGLLNAARYGVPQTRERAFLVALHGDFDVEPSLPIATHGVTLPPGYEGMRANALKGVRADDRWFVDVARPLAGENGLPAAVTVSDALDDLPAIDVAGRAASKMGEEVRYASEPRSSYAAAMRARTTDGVRDHATRYLPRDPAIFERMPGGAEYPEAHRIAVALFGERAAAAGLREGDAGWDALRRATVPPYDAGKFPNRWWRMGSDMPARTLLAHLGKDSYTHIHHREARVLSVREAARLQGFPDDFVFSVTMNHAFRMIGNAVPPPLAAKIGRGLLGAMQSKRST